eukprot:2753383-Pleurochrysis_carterae.AAC.1
MSGTRAIFESFPERAAARLQRKLKNTRYEMNDLGSIHELPSDFVVVDKVTSAERNMHQISMRLSHICESNLIFVLKHITHPLRCSLCWHAVIVGVELRRLAAE